MSCFGGYRAELNCNRKRWSVKIWKEMHYSLQEPKSIDLQGGKIRYAPTFLGKQQNTYFDGSNEYFARIPISIVKYHLKCCESEEWLFFAK